MSTNKLPLCPFCGGDARVNTRKTNCEPVGQSWIAGEATAQVQCTKCGACSKTCSRNCGTHDATDQDVDIVTIEAISHWSSRKN